MPFSREELIQAHNQIEEERKKERELAQKASLWLYQRIQIPVSFSLFPIYSGEPVRPDAPYLPLYLLIIRCTEYTGEFNDWLKEKLEDPIIGIARSERGFWLRLGPEEDFPQGTKFYCATHHVSAHGAGF